MRLVARAALPVLAVLACTHIGIAGVPPPGFQETIVVSGIDQITAFEWAPNGDLWIIDKLGAVRVLRSGAAQPLLIHQLTVDTLDERGLLGLAIDPDFALNGFIYLYHTVPGSPPHNRVSRFRSAGDTLVDETPLLDGPDLTTIFHNSGCLRFGDDGMLYISMGDNARPAQSQQRNILLGKILRIAPDGSIPSDNPFVSDPNSRPEVWAYGLRNPWRFNIQPGTGNLFIGDVGDGTWEELNLGIAGANYGYPLVEGPQPPGVAGMTYPILSYPHNGMGASVTGGDHMIAGNFPAQYAGDYFYGEFVQNRIVRVRLDGDTQVAGTEDFATSASSPVHIRVGPDSALYYASIVPGTISRIGWVGGTNQQPVAVPAASPDNGLAPLSVQFDASGSYDPDGGALSFRWLFGDGGASEQSPTAHTYPGPGVFTVTLEAFDGQDTGTATLRIVSGNRAPTASIQSPAAGLRFDAGDTIAFSGSASDPEDGPLPPGSLAWQVLFHHNTHVHPFLGPLGGTASGSFTTADTGETDPDFWYEVRLTATDSGSPLGSAGVLSSTRSVAVLPNLSQLSFATAPRPDLALLLDDKPLAPPRDVTGVVGMKRIVEAISPQTPGDGHVYTFLRWSDGGAARHTITTPAADTTFVATYGCDLQAIPTNLDLAPAPAGRITLSWTPPADACLAAGPVIYRIYASPTRLPSSLPGAFPADPFFTLIGETAATSITLTPAGGAEYYIVVGIGSDGAEGPAGHYGR